MVKVREDHPKAKDGTIDLAFWLDKKHEDLGSRSLPLLTRACQFIGEFGYRPKPYHSLSSPIRIGMEMVDILCSLHVDQESLVAALLYRLVREQKIDLKVIRENFGNSIATLLEGVLGMVAISLIQSSSDHKNSFNQRHTHQLEKIRKMIVSIVDDVRVALIKIAEQICIIRLIKDEQSPKYRQIAHEIFAIYAPLAHRLGIGYLKWELEDLAFRVINPIAYKKIAKLLDEKRSDREEYILTSIAQLNTELKKEGIQAHVEGRVKHIYSIWRKMQRKTLKFHELYDIRAIRILVDQIEDCYAALSVVHSLWTHIPTEFDDYIAIPKLNGYQSLHTAILGPSGKTLEIQIRTHDMHKNAELGVCSHWTYKGTDVKNKSDQSYEKKLNWLRQVLAWHDEIGQSFDNFSEQVRSHIKPDRVYVFTKDGHVIDLPLGATPIDFAYRIHTDIGHGCHGAKVGGKIVPLTYTLKTGDQIQILSSKKSMPSRNWLNPGKGYVLTNRARSKVINWFRKQDKESNIIAGQKMLEEECKKLSIQQIDYQKLAKEANFVSADEMFLLCGTGELRLKKMVQILRRMMNLSIEEGTELQRKKLIKLRKESAKNETPSEILIDGIGNLLTNKAQCCNPMLGDEISGYITFGRGVMVHRSNCDNFLHLRKSEPERIVSVHWSQKTVKTYPVLIKIEVFNRPGIIRDITHLLSEEKINLLNIHTHLELSQSTQACIECEVEISDLTTLSKLLEKMRCIPNIISALQYDKLLSLKL